MVEINRAELIPEDLVFTTEKPQAPPPREQLDVVVDGELLSATRPKDAVLVMLIAEFRRRGADLEDKLYAALHFLQVVMDADSYRHLTNRLEDPADAFELAHTIQILEALLRRWAPDDAEEQSRAARRAAQNGAKKAPERRAGPR